MIQHKICGALDVQFLSYSKLLAVKTRIILTQL